VQTNTDQVFASFETWFTGARSAVELLFIPYAKSYFEGSLKGQLIEDCITKLCDNISYQQSNVLSPQAKRGSDANKPRSCDRLQFIFAKSTPKSLFNNRFANGNKNN